MFHPGLCRARVTIALPDSASHGGLSRGAELCTLYFVLCTLNTCTLYTDHLTLHSAHWNTLQFARCSATGPNMSLLCPHHFVNWPCPGQCIANHMCELTPPNQLSLLHLSTSNAGPEFLNVTVSTLCDGAIFSWLCAKFWDFHAQTKNLCILTSFTFFFCLCFTHIIDFKWYVCTFLAQNVGNRVLTAQKNLILECLPLPSLELLVFKWSCVFLIS